MSIVKRFKRLLAVLATLGVVGVGTLALTAPAASADVYYGQSIDVSQACYLKYGGDRQLISARSDNYADAYSWYCQRKTGNSSGVSVSGSTDGSFSASVDSGSQTTVLGGVDMQLYCDRTYPGTVATISDYYATWWNAFNWRCD